MPFYRLLMLGKNFLIEGKTQPMSFYQSFILHAQNAEKAELKAVEKIQQNDELQNLTLAKQSEGPMIFLDEIDELEGHDHEEEQTGRAWFTDQEC